MNVVVRSASWLVVCLIVQGSSARRLLRRFTSNCRVSRQGMFHVRRVTGGGAYRPTNHSVVTSSLQRARGQYLGHDHPQYGRHHVAVTRREVNFTRRSLRVHITSVLPMVFQFRAKDANGRELITQVNNYRLRRNQGIIFSLLATTTYRRHRCKTFIRLFILARYVESNHLFLPVTNGQVSQEVTRVIRQVIRVTRGLRFRERSTRRPIRMTARVLSAVLFPDPCLE